MRRLFKIMLIFTSLLFSMMAAAETAISFFPSKQNYTSFSLAMIKPIIKKYIDINRYKNIKVQIIYNAKHQPDHIIVYLFSKKYHHIDVTKIALDAKFHTQAFFQNYFLNTQDLAEQPGIKPTEAVCPDSNVEFIAFAANDGYEVDKAIEVATAAESHHLKTVLLVRENATRSNYLNYMACPNLKGNFYDGDSNPEVIITADGVIFSSDIDKLLRNHFRYKVTNIWVACEAYNNPMKTAVMDTAQSQKFASGINLLQIGPSDEAAVCAIKAAMEGKPMTASFQTCYNTFDKRTDGEVDLWGFGGSGSDYFGI